jgi:hypothetical protein
VCHQFKVMVIGDQVCYDCGVDGALIEKEDGNVNDAPPSGG